MGTFFSWLAFVAGTAVMVLLAEPPGAIVAIIAVVVVGVLTTAATLGVRGHARPRRARRPQTIEPRSSVTPAWTSPSISPISAARPGTSPARARPHFVGRSTKLPRLRGGRAAPTAPLTTRPRSGSAATAPAWLSPASCSSAATTSCANSATGPCSPPDQRGGRCARSPYSHRCPAARSPHAPAATTGWTASKDRAAATRHGTPHQPSCRRPGATLDRGPRYGWASARTVHPFDAHTRHPDERLDAEDEHR